MMPLKARYGEIPMDQHERRTIPLHTMMIGKTGMGKTYYVRDRLQKLRPHLGEDCEVYLLTSKDTWSNNRGSITDVVPEDRVYIMDDENYWCTGGRNPEMLLKEIWARAEGNDRMFVVIFDDLMAELTDDVFGNTLLKFLANGAILLACSLCLPL